jgi:hypothetical protein
VLSPHLVDVEAGIEGLFHLAECVVGVAARLLRAEVEDVAVAVVVVGDAEMAA